MYNKYVLKVCIKFINYIIFLSQKVKKKSNTL